MFFDEETLEPFTPICDNIGQGLIQSLVELKYVTINNNQLQLTLSGQDYIRRHGDKYPSYIQQLSNNLFVCTSKRINDLGEEVDDYNNIQFKSKASGEEIWPISPSFTPQLHLMAREP